MSRSAILTFGLLFLLSVSRATADEQVRLQETFVAGQQFRVYSRMKGASTLLLPPEKDAKSPQSLTKEDESAIDYVERVLENDGDGLPNRMLRVYDRIDFRRTVGREEMKNTVRDSVRRLVVKRDKHFKVPFSPDGPLLLSEIELVRVDVFTPSLRGLLPADPVKPGDTWKASEAAVRELTDLAEFTGGLECKLLETKTENGRRVAIVTVAGTVRGVGEDGPTRHELDGHYSFDLESNYLRYLSLRGKQFLLDKEGKDAGRMEGTQTITREFIKDSPKLSDDVVRAVKLTDDGDNTLLLYDNEEIGVKFLYPRRWRVHSEQGRQVMIDADGGNGILLTPLNIKQVPSPTQYSREIQDFLRGQDGKLLGSTPARRVQTNPDVEYFGFEAEMKGERLILDYYIARHGGAGATLAARLTAQDARDLRPEIERIARSLVVK
jgi:hypothetical protein